MDAVPLKIMSSELYDVWCAGGQGLVPRLKHHSRVSSSSSWQTLTFLIQVCPVFQIILNVSSWGSKLN